MRLHPSLLAAAAWTGLCLPGLSAQVIISEINFEPGNQWIEFLNSGTNDVDLSSHSIYLATKTPFRTNNYWFGVPTGTKIKAGALMQIFWGGKIPSPPPTDPRVIYTGDSNANFLFGHGYETLDPNQGAIGLCNTKLNNQMNNPGIFDEWVQWGETGFPREQIAIDSGLWTANTTLDAVPTGRSIAVLYFLRAGQFPPPMESFFFDLTPTSLGHNAFPLAKDDLGGECNIGRTTPAIKLVGDGWPINGNEKFSLSIENTQGPAFFETAVVFLSLKPDVDPWGPCTTLSFANPTIMLPFIPSTVGRTTIGGVGTAISHPSTRGATIYLSALVFSDCSAGCYNSFSNRLRLTISN